MEKKKEDLVGSKKYVSSICDGCGKEFKEEPNLVYNENYNVQEGIIYCNKCAFENKQSEILKEYPSILDLTFSKNAIKTQKRKDHFKKKYGK